MRRQHNSNIVAFNCISLCGLFLVRLRGFCWGVVICLSLEVDFSVGGMCSYARLHVHLACAKEMSDPNAVKK